jgi:hypothetical protein
MNIQLRELMSKELVLKIKSVFQVFVISVYFVSHSLAYRHSCIMFGFCPSYPFVRFSLLSISFLLTSVVEATLAPFVLKYCVLIDFPRMCSFCSSEFPCTI